MFKPRALARFAKSSDTYTFNRAIHTNVHTHLVLRGGGDTA